MGGYVSSGHGVVFLGCCTLQVDVGSRRDHIGITVGSRTIIWDHVRFSYKSVKVLMGSRATSGPLYNTKGGVEQFWVTFRNDNHCRSRLPTATHFSGILRAVRFTILFGNTFS